MNPPVLLTPVENVTRDSFAERSGVELKTINFLNNPIGHAMVRFSEDHAVELFTISCSP